MKFKKGDRVRCIRDCRQGSLGGIYEVHEAWIGPFSGTEFVTVSANAPTGDAASDFELFLPAAAAPQKPAPDPKTAALQKIAAPSCGCTPICHCNDNVDALMAWKTGVMEMAQEALSAPAANDNTEVLPKIDGEGVKGCMASPKDPLELIDPGFPLAISKVLLKGAKKYAPHNWMRGMSWETVMGGIERHLNAFRRGEEMDPETGEPHLAHAACGLMFLLHYAHGPRSGEYRRLDDRVFKRSA